MDREKGPAGGGNIDEPDDWKGARPKLDFLANSLCLELGRKKKTINWPLKKPQGGTQRYNLSPAIRAEVLSKFLFSLFVRFFNRRGRGILKCSNISSQRAIASPTILSLASARVICFELLRHLCLSFSRRRREEPPAVVVTGSRCRQLQLIPRNCQSRELYQPGPRERECEISETFHLHAIVAQLPERNWRALKCNYVRGSTRATSLSCKNRSNRSASRSFQPFSFPGRSSALSSFRHRRVFTTISFNIDLTQR